MRENLRRQHALQLITGAGGDVANVDPNDWLKLGNILKGEYEYLEDFAHEIADGTAVGIENRAELYAESTNTTFWKQLTSGADLPVMPGEDCDGLGRCGCSWVESDGAWTWTLGATDHCDTCLAHAAEYAPYIAPASE